MPWSTVVALFFGGAFLANVIPHFVAGVSGIPFFTPFATPPFRGLSPPVVNVLYGLFNLTVAYALLIVVGNLELQRVTHAAIAGGGFGLAAMAIARSATRLRAQAR